MHVVHDNMAELIPKVEFYLLVRLIILIPTIALAFLSALWGCRLWQHADRGYRPAFLREPLVASQVGQPVAALRPQDYVNTGPQPQYHVSYQPAAAAPAAFQAPNVSPGAQMS